MKNIQKISMVIAAYNEGPRISKVLEVVHRHPLINEVIVVNDGSKDNTAEVAKKFNIRLINNEVNLGKMLSVKKGIELAKNPIIMLIDADLVGLNSQSIIKLAKPVIDGKVDWTLSLRGNSMFLMKWLKMDWISGERVVPKELLLDKSIWSMPKYGYSLEALMNRSLLSKNKTFCSVYLKNLKITGKSQKIGLIKGLVGEYKMFRQISKAVPMREFIGQFFTMAKLNRKYSKDE